MLFGTLPKIYHAEHFGENAERAPTGYMIRVIAAPAQDPFDPATEPCSIYKPWPNQAT